MTATNSEELVPGEFAVQDLGVGYGCNSCTTAEELSKAQKHRASGLGALPRIFAASP